MQQAKSKLKQLESEEYKHQPPSSSQSDLFTISEPHPAVDKLLEIDPDDLSPKQAQDLLYQLNKLVREE